MRDPYGKLEPGDVVTIVRGTHAGERVVRAFKTNHLGAHPLDDTFVVLERYEGCTTKFPPQTLRRNVRRRTLVYP